MRARLGSVHEMRAAVASLTDSESRIRAAQETPRFRFVLGDRASTTVEGVVQGSGGFVRELVVLLAVWDRARAGRPLERVYEPLPGHVKVYPLFRAAENGSAAYVDLRKVARIEPHGFVR